MLDKKRTRRSKEEMRALRFALARLAYENQPLTIRHLFYLAVAAGLISKTEEEYQNAVIRNVTLMREAWLNCGRPEYSEGLWTEPGVPLLPFDYIVDAGRWIRKPRSYEGIEAALRDTANLYRRDLWRDAPDNLILICEKDAIAELVYQETSQWDVPLCVIRGFSSITFLYQNALAIDAAGKDTYLYFLGDHDGPGDKIIKSAVGKIRAYATTNKAIYWEKLAVTPEQIEALGLPRRPNKGTDTKYADGCTEVDAIAPDILRAIIRAAIEKHIDSGQLEVLKAAEQSEREIMYTIAANHRAENSLKPRQLDGPAPARD